MMRKRRINFATRSPAACGVAALAMLLGCMRTQSVVVHPQRVVSPAIGPVITPHEVLGVETASPDGPRDPAPAVPIVFRLEVYLVNLPAGSVSRDDAFWKRLDEQCVDVPTADLLHKNGLRVGTARSEEWPALKEMIESHPGSVSRLATVGTEMKNLELPLKQGVQGETVFYYGTDGKLVGRSYDRCDNVLKLAFCRTPRKLGEIRLSVAPVVHLTRKRLEFTPLNNEQEIEFKTTDAFYQNLTVDVPQDNFLILAPAPDAADNATLLGNTFLMTDGPAEQTEQVLIVVSRPFRTDEMPARVN